MFKYINPRLFYNNQPLCSNGEYYNDVRVRCSVANDVDGYVNCLNYSCGINPYSMFYYSPKKITPVRNLRYTTRPRRRFNQTKVYDYSKI